MNRIIRYKHDIFVRSDLAIAWKCAYLVWTFLVTISPGEATSTANFEAGSRYKRRWLFSNGLNCNNQERPARNEARLAS